MIRVSIEVPDIFKYRLKPIVDLRQRFADEGISVGFELKGADLRIVHHDFAIRELASSPDKRLSLPMIVDERIDGAQVVNSVAVRSAMAHPDVKLWLKRNTFRDYRWNNSSFVADRYHYQKLNDLPEFHRDVQPPRCTMPVTEEMAGKIRLLPTVCCDRFDFFRNHRIDWRERRPIDVSFAGLVDYEVRETDYWDGKLEKARATITGSIGFLPELHRRAAVLQLARLRHLRVLIGMNRALQSDIYETALTRTSISVSPWGFGEYAYRDYESILAGCVMIKPPTDHVETFAPDIYQSGKYYIACQPDFSDLPDLVEDIMRDRDRAIELARRAREDMLHANTPRQVYSYYLTLFCEALGVDKVKAAAIAFPNRPIMALDKGEPIPVRAGIEHSNTGVSRLGTDRIISLTEDHTERNSHDLRLFADAPAPAGLYRLRFALRKRDRRRAAVQLHVSFKDQVWVAVDMDAQAVERVDAVGSLFKPIYGPEVTNLDDGWFLVAVAVQITDLVEDNLGLVVYSADETNHAYDGDGRVALDIAALDLVRLDLRS